VKVDGEGSEVSVFQETGEFRTRMRPAVILEANDVVLQQANTSARDLTDGCKLLELAARTVESLVQEERPRCSELLGIPEERAQAIVTRFWRSGFWMQDSETRVKETL
jgi:hypothetical protein